MDLFDEPSPEQIAAASLIWQEAESLRIGSLPYGSYLDEQRHGFVQTVSRSDAWLTVAVRDAQVAGLIGGLRPAADRPAAVLAYVAVAVAQRRRGIGRVLVRHASQRARTMGVSAMVLTVFATNEAAQRLYESAGWVRTGRTESTPIDDELLIEYRLDLPSQ